MLESQASILWKRSQDSNFETSVIHLANEEGYVVCITKMPFYVIIVYNRCIHN